MTVVGEGVRLWKQEPWPKGMLFSVPAHRCMSARLDGHHSGCSRGLGHYFIPWILCSGRSLGGREKLVRS